MENTRQHFNMSGLQIPLGNKSPKNVFSSFSFIISTSVKRCIQFDMHVCIFRCETHFDDNIHWTNVGFPIGVNGHCSDLHQLPWEIVEFVCLNEGGVAFGVKLQLR